MLERVKNWLRNLWQKVTEPIEQARARAAIEREETIAEAPRAEERGRAKFIAYEIAQQLGPGVPSEEIAPKVAEYLRSLRTSGGLQQEVERVGRTLPQPTRSATRALWQRGVRPVISGAWQLLLWGLRQISRPYYFVTSGLDELRTASRELGLSGVPHRQVMRDPELRRKWEEVQRRAASAAVRGFLRPEMAEAKAPHVVPAEEMPSWVPQRLRKVAEIAIDVGIGMLLDPLKGVKIARAAKQAEKLLPRLRALGTSSGRALATEELARRVEQGITRLAETVRRAEAEREAAEEVVKGLREQVKTAEKYLKQDYPKTAEVVRKRLLEAVSAATRAPERARAEVDRLREALTAAHKELARAAREVDEARRAWLVEGVPGGEARLTEAQARLAEAVRNVEQRRLELAEAVRNVGRAQSEAFQEARRVAGELAGIERRRAASESVLAQLEEARKTAERATRRQQAAQRGMERLADTLTKLRTGGEYRLFIGPVSVPIEPVGRALGAAYQYTVAHTPGVRGLVNWLRRAFRPTTAALEPGRSAAETRKLETTKRLVFDWLRRAGSEGTASGRRLAEEYVRMGIPEEAWKSGAVVEQLLQGKKARDEILSKLPPELRQFVERVESTWTQSRESIERMLEEAFGPEMIEYFGRDATDLREGWKFFLEGYLPHIVTDPPEKIEAVIPKLADRLVRTAPGARPGFTRLRSVETIEELKRLGLNPVEDVRILAAAHQAQAERLVQLKHMTDYLQAAGYIKPISEAPVGWKDIGKVFPWLKDHAAHPEIANAIEQVQKIFAYDNEAVKGLVKVSQAVMNVFRPLVTTFRPLFHYYNVMGNTALAMMAGMKPEEIPEYLAKAVKVLVSPKTDEERRVLDLFQRYGLEGQGIFRNVVEAPTRFVKEMERYLEKIGSPLGRVKAVVWPKGGVPGLSAMQWLGEVGDTTFRMGAFLHFLDQGFTPWEAAQMVKRYFFDYSALSAFERNVMRHVFPFYSWMRYAIPRAVLGPLEHPYYLSTKARVQERFAEEHGVDMGQLPGWMQNAIILGKDEEGKIIFLPTQPPEQTLMQFIEAAERKGTLGVLEELGRQVTPIAKAVGALTGGGQYFGLPKPKTTEEALVLALRQFVPEWEVASALRAPYEGDKPRTTYSLAEGIRGLVWPVKVYDRPYAEAREKVRAESALNELIGELRKAGVKVPETQAVESEVKKLDKAAMAQQVLAELPNNPWKTRLLEVLTKGSEKRAWDLVYEHPELFYGSNKEVAERFRKVLTPENLLRLRIYLGRHIRPADIIEHYTKLERGELPAVPPQERALQRLVEQMQTMKRAQASGGTTAVPQSPQSGVNRRFDRRLTDDEINAVIREAMRIAGVPENWAPYLRWLARVESSFNPNAVNPESGATGLMQTLPSTFRAYAAPGMTDIYNPLHNMVAAIRYIKARYGHPSRIPGIGRTPWQGY